MSNSIVTDLFSLPSDQAWKCILDDLWRIFSEPVGNDLADAQTTERDRQSAKLDNLLSGAAWEMWNSLESDTPRTSNAQKRFGLTGPREGYPCIRRSFSEGNSSNSVPGRNTRIYSPSTTPHHF